MEHHAKGLARSVRGYLWGVDEGREQQTWQRGCLSVLASGEYRKVSTERFGGSEWGHAREAEGREMNTTRQRAEEGNSTLSRKGLVGKI